MFKDKLIASTIHLLLSIALVLFVITSLIFFFFPTLFIHISDFKEIAFILISVDLVLGPLLTFVVFNKNKKSLKFDLSIIFSIQLFALVYGSYALFQAHPVYITFNVDRFTVISAKDAVPSKAKYDEYKVSKLTSAKLAFAKMPEKAEDKNDLIFSVTSGGPDLDQRVDYYEPYEENIDNIIAKSLSAALLTSKASSDIKIQKFIEKHQQNIDSLVFLPITSSKKDAVIVLDKISAKPVATIDTDPWVLAEK